MDIKSFIKNTAEKEKQNHKIVNIMMIALFSLVIIFTMCFGVNVNIGSAAYDDGKEYYVRQNLFQVVDAASSFAMTKDDAEYYVATVNYELSEKYGVTGFNTQILPGEGEANPGAFEHLNDFAALAKDLGENAHKVNLIKYKLAYALAVGDTALPAHIQADGGSRIVAICGQLVLVMLPQLALIVISAVFLALSIMSLVRKKQNSRAKLSFILLMLCCFINITLFASMSFMSMNWAAYVVMVLVFLCAVCYCLIRHAMMNKRDFSLSMLIHNGVLLLGGIATFIFFMSPIFKLTSSNGNTIDFGWAYIMDYILAENAYMSAVMAYTLTEVLMLVLMLLPAALSIAFILVNFGKFMSVDYFHNEKRIFLIIFAIINAIILLLISVFSLKGMLNLTGQYATVSVNFGWIVTQLVTIAALIVFEILYKVKPVKKELMIN